MGGLDTREGTFIEETGDGVKTRGAELEAGVLEAGDGEDTEDGRVFKWGLETRREELHADGLATKPTLDDSIVDKGIEGTLVPDEPLESAAGAVKEDAVEVFESALLEALLKEGDTPDSMCCGVRGVAGLLDGRDEVAGGCTRGGGAAAPRRGDSTELGGWICVGPQ